MRDKCNHMPSPEEIAEECRKIREGWSEDKWELQGGTVPWAVPEIESPDPRGEG